MLAYRQQLRDKIYLEIDFNYLEQLIKDTNNNELVNLANTISNWKAQAFNDAVKLGDLDKIILLRKNGFEFNSDTFSHAAFHGQLNIMKWLKNNNCPFSKYTFSSAAICGNLDNMIWLKANGCKFTKKTFCYALVKSNIKNLNWLKYNGCTYYPPCEELMVSIDVYNWMVENDYPLTNIVVDEES